MILIGLQVELQIYGTGTENTSIPFINFLYNIPHTFSEKY